MESLKHQNSPQFLPPQTTSLSSTTSYSPLFTQSSHDFQHIPIHPLYKFPLLPLAAPLENFISSDSISLTSTFNAFHLHSPFQRTKTPSQTSSYSSNYKSSIEYQPYLLHSQLHAVNIDTGLTNLSLKSDLTEEEETVKDESEESFRKVEENDEEFVELLPEAMEEESRFMFSSIDALVRAKVVDEGEFETADDEGAIRESAANRIMLSGYTASKHKLLDLKNELKVSENSYKTPEISYKNPIILHISPKKPINPPDLNSPIISKLVVFEQTSHTDLSLLFSTAIVGFTSSLSCSSSSTLPLTLHSAMISLFPSKILRQLKTLNVLLISCGFEHAAVLTTDGKVFTWGYGASGALGHDNKQSYSHPTAINSIFNQNIIYLECGAYHNAAISSNKELWTWGRGDSNQLGLPIEKLTKDHIGCCALKPVRVKWAKNSCAVACGEVYTVVLNADGGVFVSGGGAWDWRGGAGLEMNFGVRVKKVVAGRKGIGCVSENGEVFVWGEEIGRRMNEEGAMWKLKAKGEIEDIVFGAEGVITIDRIGRVACWDRWGTEEKEMRNIRGVDPLLKMVVAKKSGKK